jgi:hypothetical protein
MNRRKGRFIFLIFPLGRRRMFRFLWPVCRKIGLLCMSWRDGCFLNIGPSFTLNGGSLNFSSISKR